ncbi:Wobble nucleotide-excising tRNase [Bradyrhizobium yuanmingense]|uniref:Wobble nucleotide-excising tRNase n=1 Tax=Bradyrhizobium yuanmingense TaxID=108015 RepID=A0A1C3XLT1_9BRAD|nr:AAA family ATPase [Bradyrhizobium yuanmingense]TWI16515.1 wobble nucleotide-excising tRNase [Bradyrhizobium yuanmingense]SCB53261.1 Wobble nucleotide-excising tRNase [Bradyrhizobium yuanmingense]
MVLQEIIVAGTASYSTEGQKLTSLKPINFIFGTNGAGKTTISRFINHPDSHPSCTLNWEKGQVVTCRVYNSDFVARNYAPQLPGIFTLGEAERETLDNVEKANGRVKDLEDGIAQLNGTLGPTDGSSGKRGELRALRTKFEADCWKIKGKYDPHFKDAFTGVRNSQSKFCDKVLAELAVNTAELVDVDKLRQKAATLFVEGLQQEAAVPIIKVTDLLAIERAPVLAKKVVGREDIDVAALIRRLGNSDWVRQGLAYVGHGSQCPFCQQEIQAELAARLNAYFDEGYVNDIASISALLETYEVLADTTLKRLEEILVLDSRHFDGDLLRADIDRLAARLAVNRRLLEAKKREPSRSVTLEPLAELAEPVITRIMAANTSIQSHNTLVDNLTTERGKLIGQVWKCLLEENSILIEKHLSEKEALDRAVRGLTAGIAAKETQLVTARAELRALERQVTSVQPTVSAINALLTSFGFSGFKLRTAGERDHLYEIVRDDGNNAAATLSEGEKSFVCFLYFYHLLRGSVSESDVTSDRIVVFDDPVSSLDSDVLFVVSTLIKRILKEACDGSGQIRQVFLLTHNIYFHKEVSFDPARGAECRAHETFWVITKVEGVSKIVGYKYNPIKTSYELLWAEVRNPSRSNMTIQNTLRRIIENYFKILGNVDTDEIVSRFDGKDQQICASLFSWVNDGSHSAHEDLYISADDGVTARYLSVFRRIFEKTDHLGHYKMMIGTEASVNPGQGIVAAALETT